MIQQTRRKRPASFSRSKARAHQLLLGHEFGSYQRLQYRKAIAHILTTKSSGAVSHFALRAGDGFIRRQQKYIPAQSLTDKDHSFDLHHRFLPSDWLHSMAIDRTSYAGEYASSTTATSYALTLI